MLRSGRVAFLCPMKMVVFRDIPVIMVMAIFIAAMYMGVTMHMVVGMAVDLIPMAVGVFMMVGVW